MKWLRAPAALALVLFSGGETGAQARLMQPADLFRVERVGAVVWNADRTRAAVEIHRPGRWADTGIPTADIVVIDAASGALRTVSRRSGEILGFYRPAWSPDGTRLLFLSVDSNAVIRPWVWSAAGPARTIGTFTLTEGLADPPTALWRDDRNVVMMVPDSGRVPSGPLYSRINRGRNSSDLWRRARRAAEASVTVMESRGTVDSSIAFPPKNRIVAVNIQTNAAVTLARGHLHTLALSSDRRTISYRFERIPVAKEDVAAFFAQGAQGDDVYDRVNWGAGLRHIDAVTGAEATPPAAQTRQAGSAPGATLRVSSSDTTGSALMLSRPGKPDTAVWRGNEWVREVRRGRTEAIAYQSSSGQPLTGWILYPPGSGKSDKLPAIVIVYPGNTYGAEPPAFFDILAPSFDHPQLFAARGYAFIVPSMPVSDTLLRGDAVNEMADGLMPLLDTLIHRGAIDSTRIGVRGQSAGGWATLALLTRTSRFRTAIASASYANLESLYGSFYGLYRHGDSGDPLNGVLLRTLQLERGIFAMGGPPWEFPERYRRNSPVTRASNIRTPLLMIHGEADFIPIQQAEEMFTALYRQGKRVSLVRYAGESHTISARANVLDMWSRLDSWLTETMGKQ